jgi:hypothetical protein
VCRLMLPVGAACCLLVRVFGGAGDLATMLGYDFLFC